MRLPKKLKLKPKPGKKPTGKEKKVDHSYIFMVPNNEEGNLFLKLAKKYIDKRYMLQKRGNHNDRIGLYKKLNKRPTALMDVPIKHAEKWRVYLWVKGNKKRQNFRLSYHIADMFKRGKNARLVDLMHELQREFKTKSINESTAVKRLMERLLASYIAGKIKGKYND